jgi:hypothetical protein
MAHNTELGRYMSMLDIFAAQALDPFRIGLLLALFATMLRTRPTTGTLLPLAAGAIFVAILIPSTLPSDQGEPLVTAVLIGILTNAIWLGLVFTGWILLERRRG